MEAISSLCSRSKSGIGFHPRSFSTSPCQRRRRRKQRKRKQKEKRKKIEKTSNSLTTIANNGFKIPNCFCSNLRCFVKMIYLQLKVQQVLNFNMAHFYWFQFDNDYTEKNYSKSQITLGQIRLGNNSKLLRYFYKFSPKLFHLLKILCFVDSTQTYGYNPSFV